nr:MAG TPA: hypothetical protein [Caudoviricetes sp.]
MEFLTGLYFNLPPAHVNAWVRGFRRVKPFC